MRPNICTLSQFRSCFVKITLLILILASTCFSATLEEHYVNCVPLNSTCGSSLSITYPFWVSSGPSYCGHPAFKLECESNSFTLEINNQTYDILSINYNSSVLAVTKQELSRGPCPKTKSGITNSSLETSLFVFSQKSRNVTIFYNCSDTVGSDQFSFSFGCPQDLVPNTTFLSGINYLVTTDDKRASYNMSKCMLKIRLPVLRTEVIKLNKRLSNVYDVVSKGFEMTWKANQRECKICLESGGRCGYNETLSLPVCFCKDSIYRESCQLPGALQGHERKKHGTIIGMVIGIATGSVILISIMCLLYRHNKKNQSTEYLDSQGEIPNNTLASVLGPNESTYFGVKVFNITELQEATNDFSPAKELGKGGFGTVYQGALSDGREVAIKRMYERSNRRVDQFLNEVEILANLRHKNLLNLYGCTSQQCKELLLVYEYVSNGSCADHLHGAKVHLGLLSWPRRLNIAVETASAVAYLHSSDIVHRDVKTGNILLDDDFSVKVGDFGLARLFPEDVTHVSTAPQGTPGYVDPEYHQCYQLNEKSDVYSFGVVLAELISSKLAVDITRHRADINLSNMLKNKLQTSSLDQFVDPFLRFENDNIKKEVTAVAQLAFECLESTREMRPTMQQVLDQLCSIQGKMDPIESSEIVEVP